MAIRRPMHRTNELLPEELLNDPILYPGARSCWIRLNLAQLSTLTDPNRAELMARFKSA